VFFFSFLKKNVLFNFQLSEFGFEKLWWLDWILKMVVRTVWEFNLRSFNFDWNTKRPHTSTVPKFEVLSGIPKDLTRLRYPNLKFTIKNIQNKKYIKFSKLKKYWTFQQPNFLKELVTLILHLWWRYVGAKVKPCQAP